MGMVIMGLGGLLSAPPAFGYREIEVTDGGAIAGKVTLKGPVPSARIFPLVLYPFGPFCKKISDGEGNVRLQEFTVGPEDGLRDAIIVVRQITQGKPFPPKKAEFVSVDCMFHPGDVPDDEQFSIRPDGKLRHEHPVVTVLQNDQQITFTNRDPIIHNAQVFQSEKGNIILNIPLAPASDTPRQMEGILHFEPGKKIAQLICGMHEFMQNWGIVVDNPYYARTQKDGHYAIDTLPPGTYTVSAWHPHLKPIMQKVTVPSNGTIELNFEFDSTTVERPIYESQHEFRIGPATPHDHKLKDSDQRIIME